MTEKKKLSWYFKEETAATRDLIFGLLRQKHYTLDSLLAEVNGVQLCALVAVFRETEYWKKFLEALLNLSPEIWDLHFLSPEYLDRAFTLTEKRQIVSMHSSMLTEGRQSPLLPCLKFDKLR